MSAADPSHETPAAPSAVDHPSGAACVPDPATGHCAICADEGLEATITALKDRALAEVELGDRTTDVAVDLIEDAAVGDRILVHAGVAIARIER